LEAGRRDDAQLIAAQGVLQCGRRQRGLSGRSSWHTHLPEFKSDIYCARNPWHPEPPGRSMARLNQIEIRETDLTYDNHRGWFFHPTGHHVRELLLHFLPRGFVLDGSSKFSAIFGPRPDWEPVARGSVEGVTWYYIEDFDIERHMTRPVEEQQEAILSELTGAMVSVARSAGTDPQVILDAAAEVRKHGFSVEIAVRKLDRSTKDRRLRVHVFRILGPTVGEVWEARVCARDGSILGIEPITEKRDWLTRTELYRYSAWSGNTFQIWHRPVRQLMYSLNVSKYY
jgi:hypothetical protein